MFCRYRSFLNQLSKNSLLCFISFCGYGCFGTVNITASELNNTPNKTIEIRTIDGKRYILEQYSVQDSADYIIGNGYVFIDDKRRPFHDTVQIQTINSISYKEFEITKTLTFAALYIGIAVILNIVVFLR
jgi:hypothetical protein